VKEEVINYLIKDIMKSLVVGGSIFDNTPFKRRRAAHFWANRRYGELSDKEKEEIINKTREND
jgi:hypothetical protein